MKTNAGALLSSIRIDRDTDCQMAKLPVLLKRSSKLRINLYVESSQMSHTTSISISSFSSK